MKSGMSQGKKGDKKVGYHTERGKNSASSTREEVICNVII